MLSNKLSVLMSVALLATPVTGATAVESTPDARPNIVLVITDQQTATALSCAGNPYVSTPNIDKLASRGTRFTKSYCTFPVCTPARASIFTGLMPPRTGITANNLELSSRNVHSMGGMFAERGYDTAYAGKWHIAEVYPATKGSTIPGFTVLPIAAKDPWLTDLHDNGRGLAVDPPVADAAIQYLHRHHERPFLLVVSFMNPHDICDLSKSAALKRMMPEQQDVLPPLPVNFLDPGPLPQALTKSPKYHPERSDVEWRKYIYVYYRLVESVDFQVGRVLDTLEQKNLAQNTIVVFTSDHGEMLGAHQMQEKYKLYEESVCVPLVVSVPGMKPRVDDRHLVSGIDILPTLLDFAQSTTSAAPAYSLDGQSLRGLIEGDPPPWRDHIIAQTNAKHGERMVRTEKFKYIRFASGSPGEQLFDMTTDMAELRNLAGDPSMTKVIEEHRKILSTWIQTSGDDYSAALK